MKSYIDGLLLNLKRANPGQEVFIQASTEILYSLIPVSIGHKTGIGKQNI